MLPGRVLDFMRTAPGLLMVDTSMGEATMAGYPKNEVLWKERRIQAASGGQ